MGSEINYVTGIPCIYALLPDKKQVTYKAFWENLKDSVSHPDTILMDFESASLNAVSESFPNTDLKGCFFHLCQALYRKITELGFAAR